MTQKIKLAWDGEKIKQTVVVDEEKYSASILIAAITQARSQKEQMVQQLSKLEDNKIGISKNIEMIEAFIDDRKDFEIKAIEICTNKLKLYCTSLRDELVKKAQFEAAKIIAKDPNAYDEKQMINQKYVIFQKMLATHPKVAANVPASLITKHLYESPIFDNPFK